MKIYETKTAPNPRRVRMFLAEKHIDMDYQQLDIQKGENLSQQYRVKNPLGKVPFLELDDGTCISETVAICRYFECLYPQPNLMGTTAIEQACIEMWQRQVEFGLMMPVGMCFQHSTGYFKDRMTPVPEYGEVSGELANSFLTLLDQRLCESGYIAGDRFTIADITALCAIDFARVVKIRIQPQHTFLQAWYDNVSARDSAKA